MSRRAPPPTAVTTPRAIAGSQRSHPVVAIGQGDGKTGIEQNITNNAPAHRRNDRENNEPHNIETVGAGNRPTQQAVGDNSGNINHTEPGLWFKIKRGHLLGPLAARHQGVALA